MSKKQNIHLPPLTYEAVIHQCKTIFEQKTKDYGTAWRILRLPSITDQIMIKGQRIRTIQEKGMHLVPDSLETELIGIINYSILALIQLSLLKVEAHSLDISYEDLEPLYETIVEQNKQLVAHKNHDYGEAWKIMRLSSIIDIILMKLLRIKKIEDNAGNTVVSEGVEANYQDIISYAVFAFLANHNK